MSTTVPPDSIILTIEPISLGGVPTMVKAADSLLRRWGHAPRLVYTDAESAPTDGIGSLLRYYARHPGPRREQRDGLDGLAIPLWPLPQWLGYYAPLVAARRELAAARIRLVVAGSAHTGLPFTYSDKPFVLWVATVYDDEMRARAAAGDAWAGRLLESRAWPRLQRQERRVLERAAAVLALSPHTGEAIRRVCPAAAPRVQTVMCPIDTEVFRPGDGANPFGGPFLLFTARIRDPRKNAAMLLRAFARVRAAHPALKLVLIGDAPLAPHLALRDELGLGESVVFHPAVPRAELPPYYQAAELFVLSSLQEGLGISFLEAMACGLPVAAYPVTGPLDVLGDSRAGVMHEDLRTACLAALELKREDAVAHARKFSWRAATEEFLANLHPRARTARMQPRLAGSSGVL